MSGRPEQGKYRIEKERRLSFNKSRRLSSKEVDQREGQVTVRGSPTSRVRRDRIVPIANSESSVKMSLDNVDDGKRHSPRRRSLKSTNKQLTISTQVDLDDLDNGTPRTEASTPSPTNNIRDDYDLRSPGHAKTPRVVSSKLSAAKLASLDAPLPDFITQTDKYGNAVTPRSESAIQDARIEHPSGAKPKLHVDKDGKLTEDSTGMVDACAETFLDSIRIMCCCLLPEESSTERSDMTQEELEKPKIDCEQRPGLLPKLHLDDHGKKCLVLDLDETLVHSSFRAVPGADFVIPVQIEDVVHFVYVAKRPGVDEFLTEMAKYYEIVIYTASLNKYADPLLDLLDPNRVIRARLFRESCVYYEGNYVKDLSLLDRDLSQAIIIDNSPSSYSFHPENAIDCSSFIDDPRDRELDQIAAYLKAIKDVRDVRGLTMKWRDWPNVNLMQ